MMTKNAFQGDDESNEAFPIRLHCADILQARYLRNPFANIQYCRKFEQIMTKILQRSSCMEEERETRRPESHQIPKSGCKSNSISSQPNE
jgi:hypothetical protein